MTFKDEVTQYKQLPYNASYSKNVKYLNLYESSTTSDNNLK